MSFNELRKCSWPGQAGALPVVSTVWVLLIFLSRSHQKKQIIFYNVKQLILNLCFAHVFPRRTIVNDEKSFVLRVQRWQSGGGESAEKKSRRRSEWGGGGSSRRRGEGCGGDEEVRGQRSAPLVISPAPERQSRPGQRRFRCQRETTDWQDQAGPLLRAVPVGPFILPSLPSPPSLPHEPSLPSFNHNPLHSPHSLVHPQNPNPVSHSSLLPPPPPPPLTFFLTP